MLKEGHVPPESSEEARGETKVRALYFSELCLLSHIEIISPTSSLSSSIKACYSNKIEGTDVPYSDVDSRSGMKTNVHDKKRRDSSYFNATEST